MAFGKAFRAMVLQQQRNSGEREGVWISVERGDEEKPQSQENIHYLLCTLLLRWGTGNVHLSVLLSALITN